MHMHVERVLMFSKVVRGTGVLMICNHWFQASQGHPRSGLAQQVDLTLPFQPSVAIVVAAVRILFLYLV